MVIFYVKKGEIAMIVFLFISFLPVSSLAVEGHEESTSYEDFDMEIHDMIEIQKRNLNL
jgi:hypothetical protein